MKDYENDSARNLRGNRGSVIAIALFGRVCVKKLNVDSNRVSRMLRSPIVEVRQL